MGVLFGGGLDDEVSALPPSHSPGYDLGLALVLSSSSPVTNLSSPLSA